MEGKGSDSATMEGKGSDLGTMEEEVSDLATMKQSLPNAFKIGSYTVQKNLNDILKFLLEETLVTRDSEVYEQLKQTFCDLIDQDIKQGKKKLEIHKRILKNYSSDVALPHLKEKQGECLLREFVYRWLQNLWITNWLAHVFCHLNCYADGSDHSCLSCLRRDSIKTFKDSIYLKVKDRVSDCVVSKINGIREGKSFDIVLLRDVADIYIDVGSAEEESEADVEHEEEEAGGGGEGGEGVYDAADEIEEDSYGEYSSYKEDLEKQVIEATGVYYSKKASIWIQECSCPEYMTIAKHLLQQEERRVSTYLCQSTVRKLLHRAQHELLIVNQKRLLEKEDSGFKSMLAMSNYEDLSLVFQLYKNLHGSLKPIATLFRDFAMEQGIAVLRNARVNEQVLGSKLIELHGKFSSYIRGCFDDHDMFLEALKDAFEMLCNSTIEETSVPEIFATFFDSLLTKEEIDEDTEQTLREAAKLFVCLNERDVISIFYGTKFGLRLLCFNQNPNNVIRQLKQHSEGNQLRSVAERILIDLISAKKNRYSFSDFLIHNPSLLNPKFDFSVTVLTNGIWPRYKTIDIKFPVEMEESLQSFKRFYEKTTKRRKLIWVDLLGYCQLLGRFGEKPVELIVTSHQAAVLLLFNSSDSLSLSDIASQLNLFPEHSIQLLHSLCFDKYKILSKKPDTETISQSDIFELNANFSSTTRKIHVPLPTIAEEGKKVGEGVKGDGKYTIEAAIVRIMKRRKVLGLEELVSECVDMLRQRFRPDIKTIKSRIEALIEREFLERDPLDHSTFRYLP